MHQQQKKAPIRVSIRPMIRRDIPRLLEIESVCFEHPWQEKDFLFCLRQRNCNGIVAEDENFFVIGYMLFNTSKLRCNLLNIAVDPRFQRRGVGTKMLCWLQGKIGEGRWCALRCDVWETNLGTQLFLKGLGFEAVRILRNQYDDTDQDTFRFEYSL